MIKQGVYALRGKRVLLLQGPIGPFFRRLARDLIQAGAHVYKVNFNGGDWLFYPFGAINFRGRMNEWPEYFESLLDQFHIDVVILFGDCRPIHSAAHQITHRRGLEIDVFEEGYIRPDFVTLERYGVNNHSQIPRFTEYYLNQPTFQVERVVKVGNTFWYAALWATIYYFMAGLLKPLFSHYLHHRPLNWLELFPWLRSMWRKVFYAIKEHSVISHVTGDMNNRYFLVPLQVHNDAQVLVHSDYDSVVHFIEEVLVSFSQHAPRESILIIKHHPMDRGYHDYSKLIRKQVAKLGLQGRFLYIHDQHLPTLLQHARGVVVINSTVGFSALHHETPLKVCGNAIYDMKGLTFQGALDEFWKSAQQSKLDRSLLQSFQGYLVQHTQWNGNFYKRMPNSVSATGINWATKK